MRYKALTLALAVVAVPLPAAAQIETIDPDIETDQPASDPDLAGRLADPAMQDKMATMVAVLGDVLLDLPLAPLAKALADQGVEAADEIPSDTTLRKLAPGTTDVKDEIAEKLPQMMGAMASLAKGMEAMLPTLKVMVQQSRNALPVN